MCGKEEYLLWGGVRRVVVTQMCHPDSLSGKDMLPSCWACGQHRASCWQPCQGQPQLQSVSPAPKVPSSTGYLCPVMNEGVEV